MRIGPRAAFVFCAGLALAIGFAPQASATSLTQFFGGQGCIVGPSSRAAALASGFDAAAIDALVETARADPKTIRRDDGTMLPPKSCTIAPPAVTNAIKPNDPEVLSNARFREAEGPDGTAGCFLDGERLQQTVQATRGWDRERAFLEYIRLLGAGLVSGEIAFYSSDILKTPIGLQLTAGDCANTALISEIRRSHAVLIKFFDQLVRENAATNPCSDGGMSIPASAETAARLSGEPVNAWIGFEIDLIGRSAGWYEGMSLRSRGRPRPPLCH